jgi:hypothetical protein
MPPKRTAAAAAADLAVDFDTLKVRSDELEFV